MLAPDLFFRHDVTLLRCYFPTCVEIENRNARGVSADPPRAVTVDNYDSLLRAELLHEQYDLGAQPRFSFEKFAQLHLEGRLTHV